MSLTEAFLCDSPFGWWRWADTRPPPAAGPVRSAANTTSPAGDSFQRWCTPETPSLCSPRVYSAWPRRLDSELWPECGEQREWRLSDQWIYIHKHFILEQMCSDIFSPSVHVRVNFSELKEKHTWHKYYSHSTVESFLLEKYKLYIKKVITMIILII